MEQEVQNVEVENTTTENTETQTAEQNVEKTFTQSEFKEALDKEAEKQNETLKENETLKARIIELENQSVVANAGVDSKFQKFILSEVSQMEGDFEDNLKDYLKENPQYLQTKETVETPKTTGVAVTKINENADTGVSAILKAKHPELFK